MNISLATNYPIDSAGNVETFQSQIEEHHHIMNNAGFTLTGGVCLIKDPDPGYPGAYQVWSKTADGPWVWVDTEGNVIEAACPIGD